MLKKLVVLVFVLSAGLYLVGKVNFNPDVFKASLLENEANEFVQEEKDKELPEIVIDEKNIPENNEIPKDAQKIDNPAVVEDGYKNEEEIREALDDIAEQIDIISWEIAKLLKEKQEQESAKDELEEIKDSKEIEEEDDIQDADLEEENTNNPQEVFCQTQILAGDLAREVIINEIAWMGSGESADDEWLELKNLSGSVVKLNGWQLVSGDGKIKVIFGEKDMISVFYLLERTNDNSVLGVAADKIYKGSLSNESELLYLFDSSCRLQDTVMPSQGWPAGENLSKRTMERKQDFQWQTSAYIGGTPRFQNSVGYMANSSPVNQPPFEEKPALCPYSSSSEAFFPLIFNEIAWMGFASPTDEWIELKNISTSSISLEGWQIIGKNTKNGDNNIEIFFEAGDLSPENPFYLLERTNDDSVLEISADKIFTGSINDSDFSLFLFDNNCRLIDQVQAGSLWEAGSKDADKRTMERTASFTWQDSFATTQANNLFGTPRSENSQQPKTPAILELSNNQLIFKGEQGDIISSQVINFSNKGESELVWNINPVLGDWLLINGVNYATGSIAASGSSSVDFSVNSGMTAGNYFATATVGYLGENSTSEEILITLTIYEKTVKILIINEIAWMGTADSSYDEWIEIFNNTDEYISIDGWNLRSESGSINVLFSSTSITAKGYFLLERTDDTTIGEIAADLIYTGALKDSGEKLELINDSGVLVDLVDCSFGWFFGDKTNKIPMERKNPLLPGSDADNWKDSVFPAGTPKS